MCLSVICFSMRLVQLGRDNLSMRDWIPVNISIKAVFRQNVKRKFYAENFAAMQPLLIFVLQPNISHEQWQNRRNTSGLIRINYY